MEGVIEAGFGTTVGRWGCALSPPSFVLICCVDAVQWSTTWPYSALHNHERAVFTVFNRIHIEDPPDVAHNPQPLYGFPCIIRKMCQTLQD